MLGFHYSAFVERIPKLFPKWIIILTGKIKVHGYIKLHVSESCYSFYQRFTKLC